MSKFHFEPNSVSHSNSIMIEQFRIIQILNVGTTVYEIISHVCKKQEFPIQSIVGKIVPTQVEEK